MLVAFIVVITITITIMFQQASKYTEFAETCKNKESKK